MKFSRQIQTGVLLTVLATVLARPQHSQDTPVYKAYSPGQYTGQQQYSGQIRPGGRLVAVRPAGAGAPVLRAVPSGGLKRVRVVPAQHIQAYSSEEQQQPLALGQHLVQQPAAYFVQRAPTQQIAKQGQIVKGRPAYQSQEEATEEEYAPDPNPQYNFSFDVKDDELTNYQNRQEERDGGVIKGSYSVVDPDGYVRTVTYTADSKNGFQAKVVREPTDVKIKFPVPTQAPEEEQQSLYRAKPAAPVRAQYSQQPQYQSQPLPVYSQQPAYHQAGAQPTYVVRRVPAGAATDNYPRVVKVLRSQ